MAPRTVLLLLSGALARPRPGPARTP
uniref:CDS n=1 Tax=Macaca mulatta TaxID=9544 RepID=A0A7R9R3S8_MACMU|nr:B [Macaca mulatta] [Macaca mulatta]